MAKCKNCINLDRQGWCEKVIDSPEPNRETECYYFQQMTNADRIRSMSDEELEKWFWWMHKVMFYYTDSRVFVHEWLKKEVDE